MEERSAGGGLDLVTTFTLRWLRRPAWGSGQLAAFNLVRNLAEGLGDVHAHIVTYLPAFCNGFEMAREFPVISCKIIVDK